MNLLAKIPKANDRGEKILPLTTVLFKYDENDTEEDSSYKNVV